MNAPEINKDASPHDKRARLSAALLAWFYASTGGATRIKLFRLTELEKAVGEKGGNVRRWLAGGKIRGMTYVPTLATLERLAAVLAAQGFDELNAK